MFTFDATPVKFIGLFIFFAYTTIWGIYELTRPGDRNQRVSGVLHLWMSVVMLLMVSQTLWRPFVKAVPLPVITATQVLSVAWFLWMAFRADTRQLRLHFAGHAAMFAAMSWHLVAMGVKMPMMALGKEGMMKWMMAESKPGGILWIAALVGIPFMTYLLVAGLNALRHAILPAAAPAVVAATEEVHGGDCCSTGTEHAAAPAASGGVAVVTAPVALEVAGCHEARAIGSTRYRLAQLHDAAMNLGMFWMSTGLMTPVLPFMAALAF